MTDFIPIAVRKLNILLKHEEFDKILEVGQGYVKVLHRNEYSERIATIDYWGKVMWEFIPTKTIRELEKEYSNDQH